MSMKQYNNSQHGNDCYIYEYWYMVTEPQRCAIKLRTVSGWCEDPLTSTCYTEVCEDMPTEVQDWFNEEN